MNRANLERMVKLLKTIPKKKFDMSSYMSSIIRNMSLVPQNVNNYSCTACAIGHCTKLSSYDYLSRYMNYDKTAFNFEAWSEAFTGLKLYSPEWFWCFGGGWATIDNTPIGASKRI